MNIVMRARQSGKRYEMAQHVAKRCGLKVATVFDLLAAGWQYTEHLDGTSRWEKAP